MMEPRMMPDGTEFVDPDTWPEGLDHNLVMPAGHGPQMNHLDTLREEATLSGCCSKCGRRLWERSGYLSDACRKCDTDCFGFVKELPPRPLALACRWALERIAELEKLH